MNLPTQLDPDKVTRVLIIKLNVFSVSQWKRIFLNSIQVSHSHSFFNFKEQASGNEWWTKKFVYPNGWSITSFKKVVIQVQIHTKKKSLEMEQNVWMIWSNDN